jgi:NitT/TauT family transport system permease protein
VRKGTRALIVVANVITVGVVLLLWQNAGKSQSSFLSSPSDIAVAIGHWLTTPSLLAYIPVTLEEAGIGLVLGFVLAIVAASVMASSRFIASVLEPFVALGNAAPRIALAPLFLLVFGIGMRSKILFVATSILFIPFYTIFRALTTVDIQFIQNARCLGAGPMWIVRDVYIPSILGSVVASLRVAVAFAFTTAILAEFLASQAGIGFEIQQAQTNLQPNYALAGIIIIGTMAFIIDRLLVLLERSMVRWEPKR